MTCQGEVSHNDSVICFLFPHKTCYGHSLEAPHRGASNEHPQHMILKETGKHYLRIIIKNFSLTSHLIISIIRMFSCAANKEDTDKNQFLRRRDTPCRLSVILSKGDNFCDFLFAFLHTKSLLKRGLL